MSGNWKTAKDDLDWSLNKGEHVKGRDELKDAFNRGDAKFIISATDAFKMGHRDEHKVSNLLRCAREDGKRLYNVGRKLINLKPI